jgi:hypothetical protein
MGDSTLHLPPDSTDEGAVARLLLAEGGTPSFPAYVEAVALLSMQLMKLVLYNRLNNHPEYYGARGAKNYADVIRGHFGAGNAGEQFAGFRNYPNIRKAVADNIQASIDLANATEDGRSAAFFTYVNNAIVVAGSEPIADPSPGLLDGWRTAGTGSPGSSSIDYQTLAGNTFFYRKQ